MKKCLKKRCHGDTSTNLLRALPWNIVRVLATVSSSVLTCDSIGIALADTLDDLISSRRIEPQLAMRIMQHFDQGIASVLGEKVKARLQFKVCRYYMWI